MPSLTKAKLMRAEARSDEARYRLQLTIDEIKSRLRPAALAQAAQDEVRETAETLAGMGADVTRRHPVKVIGGLVVLVALALGRPLRRRRRRRQPDRHT